MTALASLKTREQPSNRAAAQAGAQGSPGAEFDAQAAEAASRTQRAEAQARVAGTQAQDASTSFSRQQQGQQQGTALPQREVPTPQARPANYRPGTYVNLVV
ncbi:hypothetical protein [Zavarzinia sp. CC-PAN008]|uniref:hypothetical protein n=1 Tax=Zavarzinia sp. CC-PAN008 TaxID=3243332 RepID=UPI003F7490A8